MRVPLPTFLRPSRLERPERGAASVMAEGRLIRRQRERNLVAARLVSASAVGLIAQIGVDMPEGYFGAGNQITTTGSLYSVCLSVMTGLAVFGLWRWPRLAHGLGLAILSLNVGLFLPPIVSDPLLAGLVVAWNLILLLQQLLPIRSLPDVGPAWRASPVDRWMYRLGPTARVLSALSLVLTIAVVGYRLSDHPLALAVCSVLHWGTLVVAGRFVVRLARDGSRVVFSIPLAAAASLVFLTSPTLMLAWLALAQLVLLGELLGHQQGTRELLRSFFDHPSRLVVLSFGSLILLGTLLLTFPAASADDQALAPLDALFTATSATCVTGLTVLDTAHAFSPLGHVILLALIQVGGLGIMVLSTFGMLLLGGTLGLRGERALKEMLEIQTERTAYRLTRFIVLATLAIEAAGALLLALAFWLRDGNSGKALWLGVFHAVSAFCNAGFALWSDSLVGFQQEPGILLVIALLITLGGLGFVVLAAVWGRVRDRRARTTLQVRTVLVTSAILVALGTLLFLLFEWNDTLAGLGPLDRLVNAFFQSVTLRTAGFNSLAFADLQPATVFLMILFMFIGASPGSTGGGIKTTTLVVVLAAVAATARSQPVVTLADREISRATISRALAIVVISLAFTILGFFLLLVFEAQTFEVLLFEVVSAGATVGLSLGATPELSAAGKLVIIATMFIGRIGPLTLALLLGTGRTRTPSYRYPESHLMVG